MILSHLRWVGMLLILVTMVVTRPVAVWVGAIRAGAPERRCLLFAWIAPRGVLAVATVGILAPQLQIVGYRDADLLVPLVFALVFTSVLVHCLTLPWIACAFDLAAVVSNRVLIVGVSPWTVGLARVLIDAGANALIVDNSWNRWS